jgi:hypothetical protein
MNRMSSIVAIVPRLLPVVDGVGDYALRLARGLQNDFGMRRSSLSAIRDGATPTELKNSLSLGYVNEPWAIY